LYRGVTCGMVRVIPMGMLQYIAFENLRNAIRDM
jgi:hypothetical protein